MGRGGGWNSSRDPFSGGSNSGRSKGYFRGVQYAKGYKIPSLASGHSNLPGTGGSRTYRPVPKQKAEDGRAEVSVPAPLGTTRRTRVSSRTPAADPLSTESRNRRRVPGKGVGRRGWRVK